MAGSDNWFWGINNYSLGFTTIDFVHFAFDGSRVKANFIANRLKNSSTWSGWSYAITVAGPNSDWFTLCSVSIVSNLNNKLLSALHTLSTTMKRSQVAPLAEFKVLALIQIKHIYGCRPILTSFFSKSNGNILQFRWERWHWCCHGSIITVLLNWTERGHKNAWFPCRRQISPIESVMIEMMVFCISFQMSIQWMMRTKITNRTVYMVWHWPFQTICCLHRHWEVVKSS